MGDMEERVSKLEAARKEMEDALVVMAHLESKSVARIKEMRSLSPGMKSGGVSTRSPCKILTIS